MLIQVPCQEMPRLVGGGGPPEWFPRGLARPLHGADGGRSGHRGRDGGGAAAATEADGPAGGIHLCARIPGFVGGGTGERCLEAFKI